MRECVEPLKIEISDEVNSHVDHGRSHGPSQGVQDGFYVKSYIEIEVQKGIVSILERAGDGKTKEIRDLLRSYGLQLRTKVDSPCG